MKQIWKYSKFNPTKGLLRPKTGESLYNLAKEYLEFIDSENLMIQEKRKEYEESQEFDLFGDTNTSTKKEVEQMFKLRPYLLEGFCAYAGVSRAYMADLKYKSKKELEKAIKDNDKREEERARIMLDTIEWFTNVVYTQKYEGGASGAFSAAMVMRDIGLHERAHIDHTSSDGSMKAEIVVRDAKTKDMLDGLIDDLGKEAKER